MLEENDMAEAPHLLVTQEDAILIATLNRPEKLNALSIELTHSLEEALLRFRDTPELKVMLIRATGRYFSSGADLRQGGAGAPPTTGSGVREMHRRMPTRMRQIWDEMEAVEKPIVVAHQGMCVGGGLEMSLSCDFRLAAKSAGYSFPEGKFGVLPATNGVSRLTRIVGPHWARYLVMANKIADSQKALTMGLVHEVFPDETFEEDVMAFVRHLAQQNGEQMGTAKVAIELAWDLSAVQAASVERMANATLMLNPAYQEGMRRHVEGIGKSKGG
jgi:enoyl-CoA hydratase